jgi:type VI secretion system protein ImpA
MMRMNILTTLTDLAQFIQRVQAVPLANSPTAGRYGLREIAWASGKVTPPQGSPVPKADVIKAAFKDTPAPELIASAQAISEAISLIKATDTAITAKVGAGHGVDFDPLIKVLKDAGNELKPHLPAGTPGVDTGSNEPGTSGAAGPVANGDIASHKDVVAAIDRICEYLEQNEPSSPIPLLLRRAQRLVGKKFLDIVKELSPDVVKQIEALGGIVEEPAP